MEKLAATFFPGPEPAARGGRYTVAVLPGDGIGPEVTAEALRALKAAADACGLALELSEGLIGQAALDATGRMLPPETVKLCREADAVLLGPVGGSRWERPVGTQHPKQAVNSLRGWLGSYATVRPIRLYPALARLSPLKRAERGLDLLLVHDHASGLVYGTPRGITEADERKVATNTQIYSDHEIERVAIYAFEAARRRLGRVVSVDWSKILETGELWRDTVEAVAARYPEVALRRLDADNFMFEVITRPERYDVVLADHGTGQLISLAMAGLTGTYALHPAAFLGEASVGVFQPSHGAAPDIAGRGVANPIAMIRAVGLLLAYGLRQGAAAALVESAVESVIEEGLVTADMANGGGCSTTAEVGAAIEQRILARGARIRR